MSDNLEDARDEEEPRRDATSDYACASSSWSAAWLACTRAVARHRSSSSKPHCRWRATFGMPRTTPNITDMAGSMGSRQRAQWLRRSMSMTVTGTGQDVPATGPCQGFRRRPERGYPADELRPDRRPPAPSRKIVAAGKSGAMILGWYTAGVCYADRHRTDGPIPDAALAC